MMKKPTRYLAHMLIFIAAVGGVGFVFAPRLMDAFNANPILNGIIVVVFVLGVGLAFRQVLLLSPEVRWVQSRQKDEDNGHLAPRLLAPMAAMMGDMPGHKVRIAATSLRTLLDGVAARLDEGRELLRYMIGLLVFLGLLGTFWGLLGAIGAFSTTIGGLTIEGGDMSNVFADLKQGLESPLAGMATAFSSSLFGLAGSVLLGFLDLQVGQAHNRFYNSLEDWLSEVTDLGSADASTGGIGVGANAYLSALLEQSADSLEQLNRTIGRAEEGRAEVNQALMALTENLSGLTDMMKAEQSAMARLGDGQREMERLMARLLDKMASQESGLDAASRDHLRSVDLTMKRLVEEQVKSRSDLSDTMRQEMKLLARTLASALDRGEASVPKSAAPSAKSTPAAPRTAQSQSTQKASETDTKTGLRADPDDPVRGR